MLINASLPKPQALSLSGWAADFDPGNPSPMYESDGRETNAKMPKLYKSSGRSETLLNRR
jgi:hypothetical protein